MKIISTHPMAFWPCLSVAAALFSFGCNDAATTAVVANGYPATADGAPSNDAMTVFKAWWVTTLFSEPVAPGQTSEVERSIPGSDFAYALLAQGWSPDSDVPPTRLIALKSKQKLTASLHDRLTIEVSDDQFSGHCAAGSTLGSDDVRLIVERIFPRDFAGASYDPVTCTTNAAPNDAGVPNDAVQTVDGPHFNDAATD